LNEIENEKLINDDTVVMLLSDHGFHLKGVYYIFGFENTGIE
jgi:hypothetical protein